MRNIIILLLSLITLSATGQVEKSIPTIKVTGDSRVDVSPDISILNIGIINKNINFNQTLTGLNEKTKDVSKQLLSIGFKEKDIRTTGFQIRENRIYQRDSYIDSGYVATQNVKVEFKYSKEGIAKILNAFSKSKTDFNLQFSFILSDDLNKKMQQDLIQRAIKDAKAKADVIAESAGVKLKRVQEIRYGEPTSTHFVGEATAMRFKSDAPEQMQSFTPEDIVLNDTILIIWEIE